jgi:hypothetical protein
METFSDFPTWYVPTAWSAFAENLMTMNSGYIAQKMHFIAKLGLINHLGALLYDPQTIHAEKQTHSGTRNHALSDLGSVSQND